MLEYEYKEYKTVLNILWVFNKQPGNGDFKRFLDRMKKKGKKIRIKWVSYDWLKSSLVKQGFRLEKNDDYVFCLNK